MSKSGSVSEETTTLDRFRYLRPGLTILMGLVALAWIYLTALPNGELLEPLETQNVIRMLLIGVFFLLLVFRRTDPYRLFQATNQILVPVIVTLILGYIALDAWGADELSREDRVIEDFSFIFCMVGAAAVGMVMLLKLRERQYLPAILALGLALVFFVIGMEEVSWFQRVLDLESSEFFREMNDQGETNFHNAYTHESEDIFYLGGFLLLVLFPFFREQFGAFLDRLSLTSARVLLPPTWLILPFVLAGTFVSQGFVSRAANVTIVIGSIVVLIALIHRYAASGSRWRVAYTAVTLLLFLAGIVLILTLDLEGQGVRPWIGKEYQEFFISWGIAAYGVSIFFQQLSPRAESTSHEGVPV